MQTKLYEEDWIGLKTLDEAGRVKFVSVAGGHLGISKGDMKKYIAPYLVGRSSSEKTRSVSDLLGATQRLGTAPGKPWVRRRVTPDDDVLYSRAVL